MAKAATAKKPAAKAAPARANKNKLTVEQLLAQSWNAASDADAFVSKGKYDLAALGLILTQNAEGNAWVLERKPGAESVEQPAADKHAGGTVVKLADAKQKRKAAAAEAAATKAAAKASAKAAAAPAPQAEEGPSAGQDQPAAEGQPSPAQEPQAAAPQAEEKAAAEPTPEPEADVQPATAFYLRIPMPGLHAATTIGMFSAAKLHRTIEVVVRNPDGSEHVHKTIDGKKLPPSSGAAATTTARTPSTRGARKMGGNPGSSRFSAALERAANYIIERDGAYRKEINEFYPDWEHDQPNWKTMLDRWAFVHGYKHIHTRDDGGPFYKLVKGKNSK